MSDFSLHVHGRIAEIGREAWEACAAHTGDPFVSYDFLEACETSGSVAPEAGWAPRHLTLKAEDGGVLGVMPLYLKGHSQGEYVFDHAWADAFDRAGGRYYPKLLGAVPFTPATGPRLLVRPGAGETAMKQALAHGAVALTEQMGVSSLHVTFPDAADAAALDEAGYLARRDMQYVWENRRYADFEAFLATLSQNRRKAIRRERRDAQAGLDIRVLTGGEIEPAHWDAFFACYMDTGSRKWGRPYLTRAFFHRVGETMGDRVALIMAFRDDRPIAGALNFIGRDALYGRQWGALDDAPFLHFELCYYRAIDFAIERGLSRVEAGAQGEHKIARGYLPTEVRSAHWIANDSFRDAIARFLEEERPAVESETAMMRQNLSPYRR